MPTNIIKTPVIDTEPDIGVGILLPFNSDGSIFTTSYTTREQSVSNLINLLLTAQGERIMQPTFGTTIRQYLFQPINKIEFSRIRNAIRSAVKFWLPYIIIEECEVTPYNPENAGTGDFGVFVYLLFRPTERGANVPVTLLYTTETVALLNGRELTGGVSRGTGPMFSSAGSQDSAPRTSNFNRVLIT